MSAESKGKWGALATALVLLLGGGTGGFFLGKAQTLKQQQQVIDVQDLHHHLCNNFSDQRRKGSC